MFSIIKNILNIYSNIKKGFNHAAYSLKNEAKLEQSAFFDTHIPRGELCEQLSKALAYTEVETHTDSGGILTTDCKSDFSLLKPHVCTVDADAMEGVVASTVDKVSKLALEASAMDNTAKRKANAPADGDGNGRRLKRSVEPEDGRKRNGMRSKSSLCFFVPLFLFCVAYSMIMQYS